MAFELNKICDSYCNEMTLKLFGLHNIFSMLFIHRSNFPDTVSIALIEPYTRNVYGKRKLIIIGEERTVV